MVLMPQDHDRRGEGRLPRWLPDLRQGQAELVYRLRLNTFTMYSLSTVRSIAEQSNLDSLS
jgi:hypothetical protein